MRRRDLLSAIALSTTALSGCTDPGGSSDSDAGTPPSSRTRTATVTPAPGDPVLFLVSNGTSELQTVTVELVRADATLIDETVTLGPDESVEYDPGIGTTGTYDLSVALADGRSANWEWQLGAYALRSGSNHSVEILPEEIMFFYEE